MQKQKIIFGVNLVVIAVMCVIYFFTNVIPDVIPVHYNIYGEADSYGEKQDLLLLITICLGMVGLMYYISQNPEKSNYPYKITDENRENSYKKMRVFMSVLSLVFTSIFLMIFLNSSGLLENNNYIKYIIYSLILLNPIGIIYFFRNK